MMKQYVVMYGSLVPYSMATFTRYSTAAEFIKESLDDGVPIHSVSKQYDTPKQYSGYDERDSLVRSVDIMGDR
jgi:hypothetical protein